MTVSVEVAKVSKPRDKSLCIPCAKMAIAGIQELLRNVAFFNLDRCVIDVKPLARNIVHPGQQLGAIELFAFRNDVAAHCENA